MPIQFAAILAFVASHLLVSLVLHPRLPGERTGLFEASVIHRSSPSWVQFTKVSTHGRTMRNVTTATSACLERETPLGREGDDLRLSCSLASPAIRALCTERRHHSTARRYRSCLFHFDNPREIDLGTQQRKRERRRTTRLGSRQNLHESLHTSTTGTGGTASVVFLQIQSADVRRLIGLIATTVIFVFIGIA